MYFTNNNKGDVSKFLTGSVCRNFHLFITLLLNGLSIYILICCLTGTAIRHCSDDKGWFPPELFNCTSLSFSKLKKEVCDSFAG